MQKLEITKQEGSKVEEQGRQEMTLQYDADWKQHIQLSDEEDEQQQLVVVEQEESDNSQQLQQQRHKPQTQVINFLDEPGLQAYISSEPSIQTLISYFMPPELFILINENLNEVLMSVIESEQETKNPLLVFNKKKFKEPEVQQWLGLQIFLGLFRFPSINDYWHAENWMKGGIETIMQEGRYKFIETHFLQCQSPSKNDILLASVTNIRRRFKKLYKPDQEIILLKWEQTYQMIDAETLYIIDSTILFQDHQEQLQQFVLSYSNKNHILYFQEDTLTQDLVIKMSECSIYGVGIINLELESEEIEDGEYEQGEMVMIKTGKQMFWKPRRKLLQHQANEELYIKVISEARQKIQDHMILKNPFYANKAVLRILFEEFFETSVYNTFCLFNNILTNNPESNYKSFRIEFARALLGDKMVQLDRDRYEIKRRENLQLTESYTNTERLSFGLLNYYGDKYHIPVFQKNQDTYKYCSVCMKFEGLTKPAYRCIQCEKLITHTRIFLCPYPCFELFHRNPGEFTQCNMDFLESFGENKYFKRDSTIFQEEGSNLNQLPIKDVHTNTIKPPQQSQGNGRGKSNSGKTAPSYEWSSNKRSQIKNQEPVDKNLDEIINSLTIRSSPAKPVLPSPSLLQPVHSIKPNIEAPITNGSGHRKQMQDLENQIREQKEKEIREKDQKEQELRDQRQREQREQLLREIGEQAKRKKQNKKINHDKGDNLEQLQQEEQQQDEEPEPPVQKKSPFEMFMAQIKKKAKEEQS